MNLWRWYQSWRNDRGKKRAARYLSAYPELAVRALRDTPDIAVEALNKHLSARGGVESPEASLRRTTQYPVFNRLGYAGGKPLIRSLPKVTPWNLRRFSEYPPSRRAINIVKNPIEALPWNITTFLMPGDVDLKMTTEQRVRREVAINCLLRPNSDDSWRQLISQVVEDLLVGGYGAIEVQPTYNRARPYFLFPVDGASIRINAEWNGDPSDPRYVQSLAYYGVTVATADTVDLLDEELIYMRLHPRSSTPFGLGYLEVAFQAVNAWLGAVDYAERRASNATPNYALFLGENVDDPQVRIFRKYWIEQIEGMGNIPIFGGGEKPQVLSFRGGGGDDELFLKWQEMLVRIIAMAFGVTPLSLGLEKDINRSTAGSLEIQEWGNIKPVISLVEDYITRRFLWKMLGYYDLAFKFTVQDTDDKRQAEVLKMRWQTDSITVNEIRQIYDKDPLPQGWGDLTMSQYQAKCAALARGEISGPGPDADDHVIMDYSSAERDSFIQKQADKLLERVLEV